MIKWIQVEWIILWIEFYLNGYNKKKTPMRAQLKPRWSALYQCMIETINDKYENEIASKIRRIEWIVQQMKHNLK